MNSDRVTQCSKGFSGQPAGVRRRESQVSGSNTTNGGKVIQRNIKTSGGTINIGWEYLISQKENKSNGSCRVRPLYSFWIYTRRFLRSCLSYIFWSLPIPIPLWNTFMILSKRIAMGTDTIAAMAPHYPTRLKDSWGASNASSNSDQATNTINSIPLRYLA